MRSSFTSLKVPSEETKKYYREATAVCVDDAEVLVIKKRQIMEELNKFRSVGKYMREVAGEKREYHKILINAILNRYREPEQAE